MMKHRDANTLVVRQNFSDLSGSCYEDLLWAMHRFGCRDLWKCTRSPLKMTYKYGGSIVFRGLNNPESLTSISVEKGYLCWLWIEEASQVEDYEAFCKLDESIRSGVPDDLFLQTTVTFNPWRTRHWLHDKLWSYEHAPEDMCGLYTTNYKCNNWLHEDAIRNFEHMKIHNPRRYEVAGLGNWGMEEGQIYENWKISEFDVNELKAKKLEPLNGLDFGFDPDPTAFIAIMSDFENKKLYVYDEFYETKCDLERTVKLITDKGFEKADIYCDQNKSLHHELNINYGLRGLKMAAKGSGSIAAGIKRCQGYEIIVHPRCENFIFEIDNYTWEVRNGVLTGKPNPKDDHLMDAMRYATEVLSKASWEFL